VGDDPTQVEREIDVDTVPAHVDGTVDVVGKVTVRSGEGQNDAEVLPGERHRDGHGRALARRQTERLVNSHRPEIVLAIEQYATGDGTGG